MVLSYYGPNSYDLLLLDIKMPNMNGFELVDKIKRIDKEVKVCFVSAYEVDYDPLGKHFPSLESEGIFPNNIISKPIDASKLIKRIELE